MLSELRAPTVGGRRSDAGRASILAAVGRRDEAAQLLNGLVSSTYKDHHLAYSMGAAYAQLAKPADAIRWLKKAVAEGFTCYPWYSRDKLLKPLSNEAGFQEMMSQMRANWEQQKAQYGSKTEAPM